MKIYTKSGDMGETSLWGKAGVKRTRKDSLRVEAYGTVDEANGLLGMARTENLGDTRLDAMLLQIQNRLFALGADLSNLADSRDNRISSVDVDQLEHWIDDLEEGLTPLKTFILPGGTKASAWLHLARTVIRRAERRLVTFLDEDSSYGVQLKYLNRLSDFLFVAARAANASFSIADEPAKF